MKLVVLAVGQRQPSWVDAVWADFAKRFPPELPLLLKTVKAEPRSDGKTALQCNAAEAVRIVAGLPKGALCVVLDERGTPTTTQRLAARLTAWRESGRDVVLLIGGPDGLDTSLKGCADETLRLSDLTLPHAFVRVLLAEALYRAWSLTAGHPYHRD